MAERVEQEDKEGRFPERGRVKNVADQWRVFEDGVIANQMQNEEFKNKWAVYEDGALAHEMQQEEFEHKYGMNRFHRRTVRDDIPVARVVQSAEEENRQRAEMLRLERQKMIADEDEKIAREMSAKLQLQAETEQLQRQLADEERARRMLEDEEEGMRQDEELARQLQQKEKEKYERKKLERERRKLEQHIANERLEAERLLAAYKQETQIQAGQLENRHNMATESMQNGAQPDRLLRVDGKLEDLGDFTDFYNIPENEDEQNKRIMQQMQDEELAKLLQEQEHKRGGHLKLDQLKAIEEQDAELARVMQEQEKLKEQRRKQKKLQQRQMSEQQQRNSSQEHLASYQRSHSTDIHPAHREPLHPHHNSVHRQQPELLDPRDEDLYEQPWTSIPRMQAPPIPTSSPPSHSYHTHSRSDDLPGYPGYDHTRQSSRDSYDSQGSAAGSPSSPGNTNTNSNMEGPTTYKPVTSSPTGNVFADLDPTVHHRGLAAPQPKPQQPLPDLQLSAQQIHYQPGTATQLHDYDEDEEDSGAGTPGDEQYAEVGDFAPVAGQRRNTIPKKGKEKKGSAKNKDKNCKQQ